MDDMHKLLWEVDGKYREHSFSAVFTEDAAGGTPRIHAGLPAGGLEAFEALVGQLEPPLILLYVLHTPRGEAPAGRYQSEAVSKETFLALLRKFEGFFCSDSRFDLWVYSPADRATVVLDRHNELFAYGPPQRYASALRSLGYVQGEVSIPAPHVHHYLPEYDADSAGLLRSIAWTRSELQPEDEQ